VSRLSVSRVVRQLSTLRCSNAGAGMFPSEPAKALDEASPIDPGFPYHPMRQRAGPRDCVGWHARPGHGLTPTLKSRWGQEEFGLWDEVSALPREYPGWVLPFQEVDRLEPVDPWECLREDAAG
jgi:hypothetical protein